MSLSYDRVREIFHACCDAPQENLSALLESLCGGDEELRAEVEGLLEYDRAPDILSDEAISAAAEACAGRGKVEHPDRIGAYRILGVLGVGGSGVVYEAEQDSPRRLVALKVLLAPLLTASMRRRFTREAEIVGRLQHPGIAQIYSAVMGESSQGSPPHIAMELIRGRPLTEFASSLPMEEKLGLFCQVCDAVQYAHEMGVVHRDLKPANILVDDEGRVKIVDFGVAYLSDPDLLMMTRQTHVGQIIGTIPYMSPEQILGDTSSINESTDVYSLGVVLFELLTGELPHEVGGLAIPEAARVISATSPGRLSTHNRSYRGDLDLIVATALSTRQEDRYARVDKLAADIRRYLATEPIAARPPSMMYQVSKFARRNTAVVAWALLLFVALVGGSFFSAVFGIRQHQALQRAERAESMAVVQGAVTDRINTFLVEDLLGAVHPLRARGEEVTVRSVLDEAAALLDQGELDDQPAVALAVHRTIGNSYRALGLYDEAEKHLRRSLALGLGHYGESDARTGRLWVALGGLLWETDSLEDAESAYRSAMLAYERAEDLDKLELANVSMTLGLVLKTRGRFEDAERIFFESLRMIESIPDGHEKLLSACYHNLGSMYLSLRRYDEAAKYLESAMEIQRQILDADHPDLAMTAGVLASVLVSLERLEEAEELLDFSQQTIERVYGHEHHYVGTALSFRSKIAVMQEDWTRARALTEEAVSVYAATVGVDHHYYGVMQQNLGKILLKLGEYDEAYAKVKLALNVFVEQPKDQAERSSALYLAGEIALVAGRPDDAIGHFTESLDLAVGANIPRTNPEVLDCQLSLAKALQGVGREEEAAQYLESVREVLSHAPDAYSAQHARLRDLRDSDP